MIEKKLNESGILKIYLSTSDYFLLAELYQLKQNWLCVLVLHFFLRLKSHMWSLNALMLSYARVKPAVIMCRLEKQPQKSCREL